MGGLLGSSNSSSSSTGKQTTTNEPWAPIQGPLKAIAGEAMNLYKTGNLPMAWQGSTHVPFVQQQMQALQGMQNTAQAGNPLAGNVLGNANSLISGGGMSAQQNAALNPMWGVANGTNGITTGGQYQGLLNGLASPTASSGLGGIASGAQGIGTGGQYQNFINSMSGPSYASSLGGIAGGQQGVDTGDDFAGVAGRLGGATAADNLQRMARGEMIGNSNPYLMGNLGTAAQKAQDSVSSMFSAGGRYGGGAHQGTVAEEVGNIYSQGLGAQMNQDIANQMSAAGQIDNARLGYASGQMNALQGQTSAQQANLNNRMAATGQMDAARLGYGNAQLSGISGLTGMRAQDLSNQMNAAGQMDQARMAQSGAQQSALQGLSQIQGVNIANQVGSAGALNDAYAQGNQQALAYSALAPQMDAMRYADQQRLFDIGGQYQGQLQNQLNDQIRTFDANQARPQQNLNWLASLMNGTAQQGSQATTTGTVPQGSPVAGALGGAAAGAGIAGTLGLGGMGGLLGTGLGGLLGAFM